MPAKGKHWQVTTFQHVEGEHYIGEPFEIIFKADREHEKKILWWAGQEEKCPETERLHMHVHLCFEQDLTFRQVQAWLVYHGWGRAEEGDVAGAHVHLEKAKSPNGSVTYVTKAETRTRGPYKSPGFPGAIQGKRNDLLAAVKMIKEGASMQDVANTLPEVFVRAHRGLDRLAEEISVAQPRPNMDTIVLYGPPGTGKSTIARTIAERLFPGEVPYNKPTGPWWERYKGEKVVILDEYAGQGIFVQELKNVLDKTPYVVPIKGRSGILKTELAIITSNTRPLDWYADQKVTPGDIEAIMRRCLFWEVPTDLWGTREAEETARALVEDVVAHYRRKDPRDERRGTNSVAFIRPYPIFNTPQNQPVRREDRIAAPERPIKRARYEIYLSDSN